MEYNFVRKGEIRTHCTTVTVTLSCVFFFFEGIPLGSFVGFQDGSKTGGAKDFPVKGRDLRRPDAAPVTLMDNLNAHDLSLSRVS